MTTSNVDISAVKIHLNELRSDFDRAMREGRDFSMLKTLHSKIKELESQLSVLQWKSSHGKNRFSGGTAKRDHPLL